MKDGLDQQLNNFYGRDHAGLHETPKNSLLAKQAVNSMAAMTMERQAKGLSHEVQFEEEHYDHDMPRLSLFGSLYGEREATAQESRNLAIAYAGHFSLFNVETMASA